MLRSARSGPLLAALTTSIVAACGGSRPDVRSPVAPAGASAAELDALYRARSDSALSRFSQADVDFFTHMIGHHQQALVMAGYAPARGTDPGVQRLAARIINAQRDEIDTMRAWLRDRGRLAPQPSPAAGAHPSAGPGALSAGMLTPAQLERLEAARGAAFDRLFLTAMIRHHRGAVAMVHELFATEGAASGQTTFKIASDIQVDQITEIERMQLMLDSLPPAGDASDRPRPSSPSRTPR